MKLTSILIEWPDLIKRENDWPMEHNDSDAVAFGYDVVGKFKTLESGTHGQINIDISKKESWAGRIWTRRKVISFWYYPKTNSELRKITDELSNAGYNVDSSWEVEFPKSYKNVDTMKDIDYQLKSFFIPIDDYSYAIALNPLEYYEREKEKQMTYHTTSPLHKKPIYAPGFGSDKRRKHSPGEYDVLTGVAEKRDVRIENSIFILGKKVSKIIKEVVMEELQALQEVLWDIPHGKSNDINAVIEFFEKNAGVDPKRLIQLAAHRYGAPLYLVKRGWTEYLKKKRGLTIEN